MNNKGCGKIIRYRSINARVWCSGKNKCMTTNQHNIDRRKKKQVSIWSECIFIGVKNESNKIYVSNIWYCPCFTQNESNKARATSLSKCISLTLLELHRRKTNVFFYIYRMVDCMIACLDICICIVLTPARTTNTQLKHRGWICMD